MLVLLPIFVLFSILCIRDFVNLFTISNAVPLTILETFDGHKIARYFFWLLGFLLA